MSDPVRFETGKAMLLGGLRRDAAEIKRGQGVDDELADLGVSLPGNCDDSSRPARQG